MMATWTLKLCIEGCIEVNNVIGLPKFSKLYHDIYYWLFTGGMYAVLGYE